MRTLEVRSLLRAPTPARRRPARRGHAAGQRPGAGGAGRPGWELTTSGRSSTTSWRSIRIRARPRSSSPPPSQRTSRIRLGHGIVQAPPAVNHPARVAERVATLDLISDGRVDFGTGQGSSQIELGGFGVDRWSKRGPSGRSRWTRSPACSSRSRSRGYEGRWISMPPREVVPKPKQRPHPPLWVACSRRETILLAAQRGSVRSRSLSSSPRRRRSGSTPTTS